MQRGDVVGVARLAASEQVRRRGVGQRPRPTGAFVAQTSASPRNDRPAILCSSAASTASVGSADPAGAARPAAYLPVASQIHGPRQGQPRVVRCRRRQKTNEDVALALRRRGAGVARPAGVGYRIAALLPV